MARHRQYAEKILSRELVILGAMAKIWAERQSIPPSLPPGRWVHAGILWLIT